MAKENSTILDFEAEAWQLDPAVRSSSLAARGLWWEMLLIMRKNERRPGFLTSATCSPLSPAQLARQTGSAEEEVSRLLRELEDNGVFSRETGTGIIFNRRMVREERERPTVETGRRLNADRQARYRVKKTKPPPKPPPKVPSRNGTSNASSLSPSLEEELNTPVSRERERDGEGSGEGKERPAGLIEHPAVDAYYAVFKRLLPIFVQEQIGSEIGESPNELALWREVLDYWVLNDYRPASVGKMIERFKGFKFEEHIPTGGEKRNGNSRPSYSQRQSALIRDALESVGLRAQPADNPDASGVERSLQTPGTGGRRAGNDEE